MMPGLFSACAPSSQGNALPPVLAEECAPFSQGSALPPVLAEECAASNDQDYALAPNLADECAQDNLLSGLAAPQDNLMCQPHASFEFLNFLPTNISSTCKSAIKRHLLALKLVDELFDNKVLEQSNTNGVRGYQILDREKMDLIKSKCYRL